VMRTLEQKKACSGPGWHTNSRSQEGTHMVPRVSAGLRWGLLLRQSKELKMRGKGVAMQLDTYA
jgi:hypothetical protein